MSLLIIIVMILFIVIALNRLENKEDPQPKTLCSHCGRVIDLHFSFCPYCGNAQRKRCSACGKMIPENGGFCPHCGKPASPDKEDAHATS